MPPLSSEGSKAHEALAGISGEGRMSMSHSLVTGGRKPSLGCPALGAASAGISQDVQLPHRNLPHHQPHPRTGQRETLIGQIEGT